MRFTLRWKGLLKRDGLLKASCYRCLETAGEDGVFCAACMAELPWLGCACERCALPLPDDAGPVCGRCLSDPPPVDRVYSLFRYAEPVAALVGDLKYRHRLWAARWCGEILAAHFVTALRGECVIVPVPLHAARMRERGFNQSLEIARPLARRLGMPLRPELVIRRKATDEQTGLGADERRRNLAGAFEWRDVSAFSRAVLVDDVLTTGATVRELAVALKRRGVARVEVVTVARTLLD